MRLFRLLSLFLCLPLVAACQDDAARLAEHLERGDSYYEDELYPEAVIEFKSAQQIDPNNADAHYKLALAYFKSKKLSDGFWELSETVRLDPSNHDAVIEFSQLAVLSGQLEEALRYVDALLAEKDDYRAHLVRGQALENLDRFEEANAAYKNAVAAEPENEAAIRALAQSETRARSKDTARAVWEKLIGLYPTFANYSLMARAAPRFSEDRAAGIALREQLVLKALDVSEEDERPRAYEQAMRFYVSEERTPEAFALLEKGVEVEEASAPVMYLLARMYVSDGNEERADELLERATQVRSDDPEAYRILAAHRARVGEFDRALESVDRAAALGPDDDLTKIQKAEILLELGFRHGREGGVEEAAGILAEVLEREPSNAFALVAHAKYKLGADDPVGAMNELRNALGVQPDWAEATYLLGVSLASQGDFANARVELGRALELDPNLRGAQAALAEVHFKLGEWKYSIDRARGYLKLVPEDHKVRLLLAQSMVRIGLADTAVGELKKIPEEKRGGEVLFALGRIRQASGQLAEAREYLEGANEALPGNWEILQAMMALDRKQDRADESKVRVSVAIEAQPDNAKLYQLRGVLAYNDGRLDDAETDFNRAIEMAPSDLLGYQRMARFYASVGRIEDTTRTFEKALEAEPEAAEIHHFLGVLHELSGDSERAIERYESAIRYGPEIAEAKNNLAYLYADRGDRLDRALDLAQEAKQQLPDNPSVSDTLGWVLYKRGVPAAAVSYLKEAEARTDSNDTSIAMVRFHLAQALVASGEEDEAFRAVERSLSSLSAQVEAAREQGGPAAKEPDWAEEARALQADLQSKHAATN